MPDGHSPDRPPGRAAPSKRGPGVLTKTVSPWMLRFLRDRISEDQLRALVAANDSIGGDERRIIGDVWRSGNALVREIMIPRPDVVFLDVSMPLAQAVALAKSETHSRFPVTDGGSDNVVGFVHLRDLLLGTGTLADLVRDVKRLPAAKRVLAALTEMRREHQQLALVVDEYGGTAGIVTLEDLVEELVGEIHDEYDDAPEPVLAGIFPAEVEGRLNLADFADRTGVTLTPGPYETLGGYVMARLGRVPVVGDNVEVAGAGVVLRVLALEGRRVARVALLRQPDLPQQATATDKAVDEMYVTGPLGAPVVGLEQ
ncbi:MAG: HlyC/CorC family transporter [Catenulispora sp.]|nr:HlyC/CorC family transporter [Catenulispora sp.]